MSELPRLYRDLAPWFHALTAPEDYAEEAEVYRAALTERGPVTSVLELGSGGGNNASHLKAHFALTLVDLSREMLELSRSINPECEHIAGDMRSVRLARTFDAVFVHDAVAYITTRDDLARVAETVRAHLEPGGVALFVPDRLAGEFRESVEQGGNDRDGKSLRYLEWMWDPDPTDSTYVADMVYLMREEGTMSVAQDRHILGLFSESEWLEVLGDAGLEAERRSVPISDETLILFVAEAR